MMRVAIKRGLPVVAVMLAAGCANLDQQTGAQMHKALGQPLANLVQKWGNPVEQRTVSGKRLVTFRTGAGGTAIGATPLAVADSYCDSTVELDGKNIVIGYYWTGSYCKAAADRL